MQVPTISGATYGLVGDGTALYASRGDDPGQTHPPTQRFWTSPEADGRNWMKLSSPDLSNADTLGYDPGHRVLYSSNFQAGFWRVVTR